MKEKPKQEPSVIVDPELYREAGRAEAKPESALGSNIIKAWKMADELASDMELATSVIEPDNEQFAVADARSDAASKIKGVFSRAAQESDHAKQLAQINKELNGLKMRFATGEEDPEIAGAKMDVLMDFRAQFDALMKG